MIGILDLDIGNLRSVANAVAEGGFDPLTVAGADGLDRATHMIVPGVGHFGAAMARLRERGLVGPLRAFAASGRPLMGLCLGMQLLAALGTEGGETEGLGLVPGAVRRLPDAPGLPVPHVGWNAVSARRAHPVLDGLKPDRDFYFVHSYAFEVEDERDLVAVTDYGRPVAAVVGRGNVVGCQFHPEKSQVNGLRIVENFCRWDGTC